MSGQPDFTVKLGPAHLRAVPAYRCCRSVFKQTTTIFEATTASSIVTPSLRRWSFCRVFVCVGCLCLSVTLFLSCVCVCDLFHLNMKGS